ncbi:MAG: hypothetical protein Q4P28_03345 [Tissierellia bacterium]|nr:hypothetical protein [Tissierellia bacterium]
MIKFILGPSGSGKTKWLIDEANKDKKEGPGNIVFIDTDDSHIFTLDYQVRLINAADYDIRTPERLYGFLSGIMSRDYDIEKIYIDGIYEIVDINEDNLEEISKDLEKLSEIAEVDLFIGMNLERDQIPEKYQNDAEVLHL